MMTREELLGFMKDTRGRGIWHFTTESGKELSGTDIEDAVIEQLEQKLEQEPKSDWIPVSERLPEVGIDVLICDMERNIYLSHRSSFGSYFDDFGNKIKDIRAWMPLPEPYRQEDEV